MNITMSDLFTMIVALLIFWSYFYFRRNEPPRILALIYQSIAHLGLLLFLIVSLGLLYKGYARGKWDWFAIVTCTFVWLMIAGARRFSNNQ